MEDLLAIVLQGLFQFLLELVLELFLNVPLYSAHTPFPGLPTAETWVGRCFWLFVGGALVGYLSLLIYPHVFLTLPLLRLINLGLAPLTSGYIMWFASRLRGDADANQRFRYAFFFTLGIALARLIWASLN